MAPVFVQRHAKPWAKWAGRGVETAKSGHFQDFCWEVQIPRDPGSPKLRMVSWNLNSWLFGGDCTPQSSSNKVIGSQGNFIFTETNISSPPENRSSLSKVRLVFSTIHFSGAKRCKRQNISENIWVSKLHRILFKTKYLSTLRSNYGSEDTAEQKFLRRVTCSGVFHRSVGVKKSLKNLKKWITPKNEIISC